MKRYTIHIPKAGIINEKIIHQDDLDFSEFDAPLFAEGYFTVGNENSCENSLKLRGYDHVFFKHSDKTSIKVFIQDNEFTSSPEIITWAKSVVGRAYLSVEDDNYYQTKVIKMFKVQSIRLLETGQSYVSFVCHNFKFTTKNDFVVLEEPMELSPAILEKFQELSSDEFYNLINKFTEIYEPTVEIKERYNKVSDELDDARREARERLTTILVKKSIALK